MKILSLSSYLIGSILMIISCLTGSVTATWLFGILSLAVLSLGCIFHFAGNRHSVYAPSVIRVQSHRHLSNRS